MKINQTKSFVLYSSNIDIQLHELQSSNLRQNVHYEFRLNLILFNKKYTYIYTAQQDKRVLNMYVCMYACNACNVKT